MDKELVALRANNTWSFTPLPKGKNAVGNKWIFRVKRHTDGLIERYKAAETIYDQFLTNQHNEVEPSLMRLSRLFPLINEQVAANYAINEEAQRRMGKGPLQNDPSMEHCYAATGLGSPKYKNFKRLVVKGPSPPPGYWKEKIPKQRSPDPNTTSGKKSARNNTGTVAKFNLSHPWDPNQ
ncbi:unnamed protein product [Rhodiola kirilowii]